MKTKYEVHNQITGLSEEASSFELGLSLRDRLRAEYIEKMVDPLFQISVLMENQDGSWTQSLADKNGNPIIVTAENLPLTEDNLIGRKLIETLPQ